MDFGGEDFDGDGDLDNAQGDWSDDLFYEETSDNVGNGFWAWTDRMIFGTAILSLLGRKKKGENTELPETEESNNQPKETIFSFIIECFKTITVSSFCSCIQPLCFMDWFLGGIGIPDWNIMFVLTTLVTSILWILLSQTKGMFSTKNQTRGQIFWLVQGISFLIVAVPVALSLIFGSNIKADLDIIRRVL